MKVSYDRLWKLLIDKKINKTQLKELAGINSNCVAKMGRDETVHMDVLVKICNALNCSFEDIVEYSSKKEDINE